MLRIMLRIVSLLPAFWLAGAATATAADNWEQQVAQNLGKSGSEMPGGVYRVGLPRTDLHVTLDGVALEPGFALGSWLAFAPLGPSADQVMAMGDLVLTDEEVNPVVSKLTAAGIDITAIHNHLLCSSPNTMYVHVLGHGAPDKLAAAFHAGLAASKTPFGAAPAAAPPSDGAQNSGLDTAAIDQALGYKGKLNGRIYQIGIPRAEPVSEGGLVVPAAMGSAIGINFQPTGGGRAAITGDFVLAAEEVNPVLKALREHGIEVTALHSHMLTETPRMFFMHFWANDDAAKLAAGLRAALDHIKVARS
ncbi:MAG TPA: DUF1259 domain-containing protein [Xanthobacteraceae bacterium]|jgi:hypothetical protein|nr:DUF1259 domain-containing protein [Xanthobacteraceae bacterium]